jgi:large subunit ribosomal protein L47
MARIKYVINERRLAYEGALKMHTEKLEQAAKKGEKESGNSADAQKDSPPVSEAAQAAVDSLLQRQTS